MSLRGHTTWSRLVHVTTCCLTTRSHCMNQFLIISEVLWHSPGSNFMRNAHYIYPWFEFENYWFMITTASLRSNGLMCSLLSRTFRRPEQSAISGDRWTVPQHHERLVSSHGIWCRFDVTTLPLTGPRALWWGSMILPLQWRHNEHDSVSNHQPHDCLLNRLFRRRSKKTSKPRVTGLCVGNSPGTGEFPAQMASNMENVSIWWRHHDEQILKLLCNLRVYSYLDIHSHLSYF